MSLNLLANLSLKSIIIIYAVMAFMVIIGRRSVKMFYCIFFSLLIAGVTTGFYVGISDAMPMMLAFIISFFMNLVVSLFAFAMADKVDPDGTFSYLFLWEVFYNASYFLIVFIVNAMIK